MLIKNYTPEKFGHSLNSARSRTGREPRNWHGESKFSERVANSLLCRDIDQADSAPLLQKEGRVTVNRARDRNSLFTFCYLPSSIYSFIYLFDYLLIYLKKERERIGKAAKLGTEPKEKVWGSLDQGVFPPRSTGIRVVYVTHRERAPLLRIVKKPWAPSRGEQRGISKKNNVTSHKK